MARGSFTPLLVRQTPHWCAGNEVSLAGIHVNKMVSLMTKFIILQLA